VNRKNVKDVWISHTLNHCVIQSAVIHDAWKTHLGGYLMVKLAFPETTRPAAWLA